MRLVEILTSEAPGAIHWLEELGIEFTRENGYRLAKCGGATRKRLLQVGDRTGQAITSGCARRRLEVTTFEHAAARPDSARERLACDLR